MCHITRGRSLVTVVPFPTPLAETSDGESVAAAVDRYLDSVQTKTTRDSYAETLARLTALAGDRPSAELAPEDNAAVMGRWDGAAAATWNRHLSALTSFTAWAGRQEILTANPARRLERRKPPAAAIGPFPAPAWTSCSPATGTAYANGSCGGCSTRPPPAPGNSCPSTSRTSTWSSGVAGSPPRAARSSTSTGPP